MTAGRKPIPTHLKLVTGNPGRRPVDVEAQPRTSISRPDRPGFLNVEAAREWDRIVPELEMAGLLSRIDGAALAGYCSAYALFQRAELKISEAAARDEVGQGVVESSKNGFAQLSQWFVVRNKALEQLRQFLSEFGMSPSTRSRVHAMARQGALFEDDPLEAALRASSGAPR